ncbi:MAG: Gfo/Idh/MocA family oxidoreductase [Spirochaetales bacterium]|nr:Gfo/Idh/MocA family oxidoreductase [Spirochaetales bacterium]
MINIALIGYGYWGPNVARQLSVNKRIQFSCICDRKEERLQRARELYLDQVSYSQNADEIINNPEITGICLAVETCAHFELARKALLAGKHVYVEKPFTSTVAEALELQRLAEKKELIIHVDHIMVFHPAIQKIKDLIETGELGDILYFDAQRMNLGQIKKDVSSMWDLAVHDLSIIDFLAGSREPFFISAVGEKYYNPKETFTLLTLRYEGFIAHIKSNWISPLKERKLIVAGTKKMVVFDDMKISEKLMVYDKGVDIIGENTDIEYMDYAVKTRTGDVLIPFLPVGDALYSSVDHFVSCIENNTQSLTGPESAIHVIKILEEADKKMNR